MDANKRLVLLSLPYTIEKVCGLCANANLPPGNDWGTCKKVVYEHEKHSQSKRELSINTYGSCHYFEPDDTKCLVTL